MTRRDALYEELDTYIAHRTKMRPMEAKPVEETETTEGWWSRVRKKFAKEEMDEQEIAEEPIQEAKPADDAVSDMKEVSRIALSVLKRMSNEQVHEFKTTPDYEKFKTLLRKYQLIK